LFVDAEMAGVGGVQVRSFMGSSRRVAIATTLVMLVTFGGPLLDVPAFAPAMAAQPPKHCQAGLFKKTAPQQDVGCAPAATVGPAVSAAIPAGFQETTVWSGLVNPTTIRFASDGRVFVAEKSGVIKIFDSLNDTTPTVYSGLTTAVQNYWDRGLLGLALDPSMTGGTGNGSFVYVLYAYDHILGTGGSAPRWGDGCPTPPGPTTDGCVVSGRLSRFAVSGSSITGSEQVLIEDWCQQFPSHSIGSLNFGPDGALYISGGDGASFNYADYGQSGGTSGSPPPIGKNPCGDPPNDGMSPPTAEGGALRSQDVRTLGSGGSSYSQVVLADNPVAYWRLGEASGTNLVDQIGNHGGTYVGSPTLGAPGAITGDANTSVTFNGSSNVYGQATGWTTIPAPPITIEAWIKWNGTTWPTNTSILGWFDQPGTRAARFWVTGNGTDNINLRIGFETGNANWNWVGENTSWHQLVGTHDGTNARLYFDGVLVAGPTPVPFSGGASAHPLWIGNGSDLGTADASWPGGIDEAAVYNQALSAAQVQAHYAAGVNGQGGGDPTTLDGAILRVDPNTGAGMAGNPFAGSTDPNARRIIAYGLRNPFRVTFRPGTNELWVGDVGWNTWEEINRIPNVTDATAENFGWPCYEGVGRQSGYDGLNLNLCEQLYTQGSGAVASPYFTYNHNALVVPGETCPSGGSSITGMAFYPESGGSFPAAYRGGVFFSDHTRNCIWFMPKGTNGQPDPTAIQTFAAGAAHPVDLIIGPNGDLFYPNFDGGTIQRITPTGGNQPPTAVIQATPTSGPAPLTVQFSGSGSSDPEGTQLTYAWDLDGDGAYDDATGVSTSRTYTAPGNVTVGLRVTDAGNATGTDTQVIAVSNTPPTPVISTPLAGTTFRVGDLITFSGSATDAQDGTLPASALSWSLVIQHCPSSCHTHQVQTWPGASGMFNAPDHEYPSYLELTLTATDSFGTQASVTRRLDPQTVVLSFQTAPTGLSLAVNAASTVTPFTRTVIIGSANSATATSPQTLGSATYSFSSWSDGGAQSRTIVAPATNTTYTATYLTNGISFVPIADAQIRSNQASKNFGTSTTLRVRLNQSRSYLKFTVTGLTGPPTSAVLRLRVIDGSTSGGSVYHLTNTTWTESGITWNNAPAITGTALSSLGSVTTATWVDFNLGSVITGNGTYTFAISGGNSDFVDYASRETGYDPVLVLFP
jgi:glucose/arabinose dehydrogenase/PKD repeat protein